MKERNLKLTFNFKQHFPCCQHPHILRSILKIVYSPLKGVKCFKQISCKFFSLEPQENKRELYEGLKKVALTILCLWDGLSKHIFLPPP